MVVQPCQEYQGLGLPGKPVYFPGELSQSGGSRSKQSEDCAHPPREVKRGMRGRIKYSRSRSATSTACSQVVLEVGQIGDERQIGHRSLAGGSTGLFPTIQLFDVVEIVALANLFDCLTGFVQCSASNLSAQYWWINSCIS